MLWGQAAKAINFAAKLQRITQFVALTISSIVC
jgi:hypothetical protein